MTPAAPSGSEGPGPVAAASATERHPFSFSNLREALPRFAVCLVLLLPLSCIEISRPAPRVAAPATPAAPFDWSQSYVQARRAHFQPAKRGLTGLSRSVAYGMDGMPLARLEFVNTAAVWEVLLQPSNALWTMRSRVVVHEEGAEAVAFTTPLPCGMLQSVSADRAWFAFTTGFSEYFERPLGPSRARNGGVALVSAGGGIRWFREGRLADAQFDKQGRFLVFDGEGILAVDLLTMKESRVPAPVGWRVFQSMRRIGNAAPSRWLGFTLTNDAREFRFSAVDLHASDLGFSGGIPLPGQGNVKQSGATVLVFDGCAFFYDLEKQELIAAADRRSDVMDVLDLLDSETVICEMPSRQHQLMSIAEVAKAIPVDDAEIEQEWKGTVPW